MRTGIDETRQKKKIVHYSCAAKALVKNQKSISPSALEKKTEVGLNYLVGLNYFVLIPGVWEIKQ